MQLSKGVRAVKTEEDWLTEDDMRALWAGAMLWGLRVVRGCGYAIVAFILVRLNTYGLADAFWLSVALGLLGAGTASARLGQLALAGLLVMAVFPLNADRKSTRLNSHP